MGWQKFMGLAEKMPGLRRETLSEVSELLFDGRGYRISKVHEFYFDSREALDAALRSSEGQAAGMWLHEFSHSLFTMVIAEHQEAFQEEFVR